LLLRLPSRLWLMTSSHGCVVVVVPVVPVVTGVVDNCLWCCSATEVAILANAAGTVNLKT
jgi:hypothetical protein